LRFNSVASDLALVLHRLHRKRELHVELALGVGEAGVDVHHLRVALAVALEQPHLLALQLDHLGLAILDRRVLRDHGDRVGRRAGRDRLHLVVERLFLHPRRARLGRRVVQLIEARQDDVLLVVERQRVLLLAILRQRLFAFLDPLLLVLELLVEPVEHPLRRAKLDFEVLAHVLVDQRVHRFGRELRILGGEGDVHQMAAAHRLDADAADERANQRRLVGRLVRLRRLGGCFRRPLDVPDRGRLQIAQRRDRRRRRRFRAVEFRHRLETQAAHDAAGEVAPLQDLVLRLVIRLGVFVVGVRVVLEPGNRGRSLILDEDPPLRDVDLDVAVSLNHHRGRHQDEDRDAEMSVPVKHRQPVEQVDVAFRREMRRARPTG
jgi:hypothetical protein